MATAANLDGQGLPRCDRNVSGRITAGATRIVVGSTGASITAARAAPQLDVDGGDASGNGEGLVGAGLVEDLATNGRPAHRDPRRSRGD